MGLEQLIREKIATEITDVIPGEAKILKRNPFETPREAWIGNFTFIDSEDNEQTHAWFIRRNGVSKTVTDVLESHLYVLSGFYGYNAGDSKGASENDFQEIVDLIKDKLMNVNPNEDIWGDIEIGGQCDSVASYSISFTPIGLIKTSKTALIHFASAEFLVKVQK